MNTKIITNNPLIQKKLGRIFPTILIDGGYIDVLYNARDRIHEGAKLLTHPLMGSVKPNETPYRTIIIENCKGDLDLDSLLIIENSIETSKKFLNRELPLNDSNLEDFKIIDLKLIESALSGLEIYY